MEADNGGSGGMGAGESGGLGGGGFGDIGGGGIGAGGGKGREKKVSNVRKKEAAVRRKEQKDRARRENNIPPPPLRVFSDGSRLIKDWSHSHAALLQKIFNQEKDICWALVLGTILQFVYNMNLPPNQQNTLDIDSFVRQVKMAEADLCANKKLDPNTVMSVNSLKQAMDHILHNGIEKDFGRKRGHEVFTVKGSFASVKNQSPQDMARLLDIGPIGITLDVTGDLMKLKDEIYVVPMPINGVKRHVVMIVAYGMVGDQYFFLVQNTWGKEWGVEGHGRIMIQGICDDIVYLQQVITGK